MTASERPFVPVLRCPCCGHVDRTVLCHECGTNKLPKHVKPFATELQAAEGEDRK